MSYYRQPSCNQALNYNQVPNYNQGQPYVPVTPGQNPNYAQTYGNGQANGTGYQQYQNGNSVPASTSVRNGAGGAGGMNGGNGVSRPNGIAGANGANGGNGSNGGNGAVVNDVVARNVEQIWKQSYPGATLLPVIGLPSNGGGVGTLTHTMSTTMNGMNGMGMNGNGMSVNGTMNGTMNMPDMKINGLTSKSPLSNNALYSFEVTGGKYLNLYEIMVPDIPGQNGAPRTAQIYINALHDQGLDVAGVHFHWTGSMIYPNDSGVTAVHHQNIGMSPQEFSTRTIAALSQVMPVIQQRAR